MTVSFAEFLFWSTIKSQVLVPSNVCLLKRLGIPRVECICALAVISHLSLGGYILLLWCCTVANNIKKATRECDKAQTQRARASDTISCPPVPKQKSAACTASPCAYQKLSRYLLTSSSCQGNF